MKTDDKDMLTVLSGIDETLIEEAYPYGAGAAGTDRSNKAACAGGHKDAGKVYRGKWLRPAMGIAAAAAVLIIGIVIWKLGVPTAKPGNQNRPGTEATTPTQAMPENTATPTSEATPTQGVPEETPTPSQPVKTPTPVEVTPTPTPDGGGTIPFFDPDKGFRPRDKHSMTQAEVMTSDFYRYLSPELLAKYKYNLATKYDDDREYKLIWYNRETDGGRNIIGIFVQTKENAVNYGSRVVSASEASVYDVRDREDPVSETDREQFYTAANSPIFPAEEFTDEVMKRRIAYHGEVSEPYVQMWFAIEAGDYVFEYFFRGVLTDENAALFVPAEGAGPDYNPNFVPADELPPDPQY